MQRHLTQRRRLRVLAWLPLFIALLAAAPAAAQATVYTVDPAGSDSASGSDSAPFQTIHQAASVARRGDTVLVHSGRYPESVAIGPKQSGVIFRGTGESRPIIDGEGTRARGVTNNNAADVTIEDFEFTGQTETGIYGNAKNGLLRGNLFHHIGATSELHSNGIMVIQGTGTRVIGNVVHSIGPGAESMGIWLLETTGATVSDNSVYLVRKEGIRDWKGLDNTITRNRVFLNWVGIALNTSIGSLVSDNYAYDNTEGIDVKHLATPGVLTFWNLATPHYSRVWRNTVYRSTETSLWIGQSGDPLDYLDVRNNLFEDAGTAYVRDAPSIRGQHVIVDGNGYGSGPAIRRPPWLYRAGWSADPGLRDLADVRGAVGWERDGTVLDPQLRNPGAGELDYPADSPARFAGVPLDSADTRIGSDPLGPPPAVWTPFTMTPVDSSSKGTTQTKKYLKNSADDNQDSYWLTSTAEDEYVVFDFGQPRVFTHVILTLFSHNDGTNPHRYRLEVSDDRAQWRTLAEGANPDMAGAAIPYELHGPTEGRYLRYTMLDTSCASYTPRTTCGDYFVLSDLKAGYLAQDGESPPPSHPGGQAPPPSDARRPAGKLKAFRPRAPTPARSSGVTVSRRATISRRGVLELRLACSSTAVAARGRIRVALPHRRGRRSAVIKTQVTTGPRCPSTLRLRIRGAARRRLGRRGNRRLTVTVSVPGVPAVRAFVSVHRSRH